MGDPDPPADTEDPGNTPGTLMSAEAVIQTPHAARYLARLCRHASQMPGHASQAGRLLRHRPRAAGAGGRLPEVRHAEWSQAHGTVDLNWGRWTLHAAGGTLIVHAEAASEQNLRQIQDLLTARLESFGRREHLTVTWQRPAAAGPR